MANENTASIDPTATVLTLIDIYEVKPGKLAEALSEATESAIRHQPGFISVRIHGSLPDSRSQLRLTSTRSMQFT